MSPAETNSIQETNNSTSTDPATVFDETRNNLVVDSISTDVQNTAEEVILPSNTNQISVTEETLHDLTKLLSRPTLLDTFVWDSTYGSLAFKYDYNTYINQDSVTDYAGVINTFDFPTAIANANPTVLDKLSQFMYIKSDIEIELKVNASPFAAGALGLHYIPYLNEVQKMAQTGNITFQGLTTCPYVKMILGQTNSVKLVVPWINEFDMFNVVEPGDYFGSVVVSCLSPLKDGSSAPTATVSVFARFINPIVRVPTQVLPSAKRAKLHALIEQLRAELEFEAQGAEGEHQGPITTITDKVATVAGALSNVPVIGNIAKPVSWVARLASKVASVFGFSKPSNQSAINFVDRVPARGYTNLEGYDNSVVLGSIPDNAVSSMGAVNENIDQMSIDVIKQQSNIFTKFTWTSQGSTFNQGKLFATSVAPSSNIPLKRMSCQLGSLAYLTTMATYWRGSLDYTLTFVATRFHAGRLLIVYFPDAGDANIPSTVGSLMSTNYHMVVDLNEMNTKQGNACDFTFRIPYTRNYPWLPTMKAGTDELYVPEDGTNGSVAIYALTDLIQPDTCSSSIDILMSIRGGDDFKLAMPRSTIPIGWLVRPTPPAAVAISEEEDDSFQAEGLYDDVNGEVHHLIPQTNQDDATVPCMGEYFTSLRAFAKRAAYIRPLDSLSLIIPGYLTRDADRRYDTTGMPLATTPFEQVASLFRFSSGSVRYKVKSCAQETVSSHWVDSANNPLGIEHETNSVVNNIHEVAAPYYKVTRLISHASSIPRFDDKRVLIQRVPLQYTNASTSEVVVPAFSSVTVDFLEPTVVSFDRYGYTGFPNWMNDDFYFYANHNTPGGKAIIPIYEHGQWVHSNVVVADGHITFTNNSDTQRRISYRTTRDFSPVATIMEAAGDDWSAFFMVPPPVVRTRDYQVA